MVLRHFFDFLQFDFPLEDAFFYVPLKVLFPIIGIKLHGEYTKKALFFAVFNGFSSFLAGVLFLVAAILIFKIDLVKSLNSFGPAFSMLVMAFKFCYVLRFRGEYGRVVDFGKSIFFVGKCFKSYICFCLLCKLPQTTSATPSHSKKKSAGRP